MHASAEQNKAVIQRFIDACNRRGVEASTEFVAADVVRHYPATPHIEVSSVDDLKAFLRRDTTIVVGAPPVT